VSPKLNLPKNDSPDLLGPIEDAGEPTTPSIERANEGQPERRRAGVTARRSSVFSGAYGVRDALLGEIVLRSLFWNERRL